MQVTHAPERRTTFLSTLFPCQREKERQNFQTLPSETQFPHVFLRLSVLLVRAVVCVEADKKRHSRDHSLFTQFFFSSGSRLQSLDILCLTTMIRGSIFAVLWKFQVSSRSERLISLQRALGRQDVEWENRTMC